MVPDALAGSLQAASRSYGIGCTPLLPAVSTHARFLVTKSVPVKADATEEELLVVVASEELEKKQKVSSRGRSQ